MREGWAVVCGIPLSAVLVACTTPPSAPRPPSRTQTSVGAAPQRVAHLDDPKSCFDVPSNAHGASDEDIDTRQQALEIELERQLEQQWSSVRSCVRGSPAKDPVRLEIEVRPDGTTVARVLDAKLPDCDAVSCIRARLSGLRIAPAGADQSYNFRQKLDVDPRATRHFQPDSRSAYVHEAAQSLACLDEPAGGRLPAIVIREKVRASYDKFRTCYEGGLARNPELQGAATFRFVIGRDGKIPSMTVVDNELTDCAVVHCVRAAFLEIEFPPPEGGIVTVSYPIRLMPDKSRATPIAETAP